MKRILLILALAGCDTSALECDNQRGDADEDGDIDVFDAVLALDIATGFEATECQVWGADWNGDGFVTEADADSIFQHLGS